MNIGIFFKHKPSGGGIYQYFLTIAKSLISANSKDHFYLFHCYDLPFIESLNRDGIIPINLQHISTYDKYDFEKGNFDGRQVIIHNGKEIYFKTKSYTEELKIACQKCGIDLMLYTNIERESFESGIPYITALLDWTHRTHPEFSEFSENGIFEQREYVITNGVGGALSVLADSETAKNEIVDYYGINPSKIVVLPFVPPPYITGDVSMEFVNHIKLHYHLPDEYIFYPAQFWPHKNHENIIKALYLIKNETGTEIKAVFVGSTDNQWSNLKHLRVMIEELGVEDQIIYLGYVDANHMAPLYKMAAALVMPTFPGPTNIPVLEAMAVGCPVITSDITALREQIGDAGIFINPYQPVDLAKAIFEVWTDKSLRKRMVRKGKARLDQWPQKDFSKKLLHIIEQNKETLKNISGSLQTKGNISDGLFNSIAESI